MFRINANIFLQFLLLCALLFLYGFKLYPTRLDSDFLSLILIVTAVSVTAFFLVRKENVAAIKNQYFKVSTFFVVAFLIVHFQVYLDFVLGNVDSNNRFLWFDHSGVCKSAVISALALVSYLIGYSGTRDRLTNNVNFADEKPVNTNYLTAFGGVLLAIFFLTVNPRYLQGNYVTEKPGAVASYTSLFLESLFYSVIILNCRNLIIQHRSDITFAGYLKFQKGLVVILTIYLGAVMISGDRGPVIYCLLAFSLGYIVVSKKKISLIALLMAIIVGSLTVSILGIARNENQKLGFKERITSAISGKDEGNSYPSVIASTQELSTSVRTVHIAVSSTPSRFQYTYGLFAIQDLMLLGPGVKGFFSDLFGIPQQLNSSAEYLTWIDQGPFPVWGIGTSCVSDVYLDFGLIGITGVFLLFGFLSRRMEVAVFSPGLPSLLLMISFFLIFSMSIYIPRSTIIFSLNKFCYVFALILITTKLKQLKI